MIDVEEKYYTVKEIAHITNVTVKTLHHYDAIGLLKPGKVSEAGYRLYGQAELERLQHILFYRELDIPLKNITSLLQGASDRAKILKEQQAQLFDHKRRLERLLDTIDASIRHAEKGESMDTQAMFKGFATEEEWKAALEKQNNHLQTTYGTSIHTDEIDVEGMNESAAEAVRFMRHMASALKDKLAYDDPKVQKTIKEHVAFLNEHGHKTTAQDFAAQATFLMQDSFHRSMMEEQQVGLAYYLAAAAGAHAAK